MRRQDIASTIVHCLGLTRLRALWGKYGGDAKTRILVFHDVLAKDKERFRDGLTALKSSLNIISLEDCVLGRVDGTKVNIVVTFDDGYRSWVDIVAPILKDLLVPATFFVSSGILDLDQRAQERFIRERLRVRGECSGGLPRSGVRQLAQHGFSIGGHTSSHAELSLLRTSREIIAEIVDDKSTLEDVLGMRIKHFAYPRGGASNPIIDVPAAVRNAGYSAAVTVRAGFNTKQTSPFLLCREIMVPSMSPVVFNARARGAFDIVAMIRRGLYWKDR